LGVKFLKKYIMSNVRPGIKLISFSVRNPPSFSLVARLMMFPKFFVCLLSAF
jgi:hypothetical protein